MLDRRKQEIYLEIITVYCENKTEYTNTVRGQTVVYGILINVVHRVTTAL